MRDTDSLPPCAVWKVFSTRADVPLDFSPNRFAVSAIPTTVSFSGLLKRYADDSPYSGGNVELVGNASIKTTTGTDGNFTLSGIPGTSPYTVKMTKAATDTSDATDPYLSTYSQLIQGTMTAARPFNLFRQSDLTSWGVTGGGVIRGRVINGANPQSGFIGGAVVIEQIFGIPGLGTFTIEAILMQDFAIVRSMVFIGSVLYIVGLILTDISYTLVDPRIRFE